MTYAEAGGGPAWPAARLSADRFVLETTPALNAVARERFTRTGTLPLPDLLTPDLQARVAPIWRSGQFALDDVAMVGRRGLELSGRAGAALSLALSHRDLLAWLEDLTGAALLQKVEGSVARHVAATGEGLDWHDDGQDLGRRRLGLTVNLGDQPYEGGMFELRRKGAVDLMASHRHIDPGAALVFAVSPRLEHRLTPVTSGGPRTVFAGWVFAAPG